VGYIDADTHVIEDEHTWDFFDPGEQQFRPLMSDGYWTIQDVVMPYPGPERTPLERALRVSAGVGRSGPRRRA